MDALRSFFRRGMTPGGSKAALESKRDTKKSDPSDATVKSGTAALRQEAAGAGVASRSTSRQPLQVLAGARVGPPDHAAHLPASTAIRHSVYSNLTRAEVDDAQGLGIDAAHISLCNASRVPPTTERPRTLRVDGSPLRKLGQGGMSSVFVGQFRDRHGTAFTGVLKLPPEADHFPLGSQLCGIDERLPMWQLRSVASSWLDQLLGFNVLTRTTLAEHEKTICTVSTMAQGRPPVVSGQVKIDLSPEAVHVLKNQAGGLSALARARGWGDARLAGNTLQLLPLARPDGRDGLAQLRYDTSKPGLRRELTRLQWLDCLCGQTDRTAQNIFIQARADGQWRVTGIDNDQSFGSALQHPDHANESAARNVFTRMGWLGTLVPMKGVTHLRGCCMPKVIDRAAHAALLGLSVDNLHAAMDGLGQAEKDAATARLSAMQTYLRGDQVTILDDDAAWASPAVTRLLGFIDHAALAKDGMAPGSARVDDALKATSASSLAARLDFEASLAGSGTSEPLVPARLLDGLASAQDVLDLLHIGAQTSGGAAS